MLSPAQLTRMHFEQSLTPSHFRAVAIIRIALMAGVTSFYRRKRVAGSAAEQAPRTGHSPRHLAAPFVGGAVYTIGAMNGTMHLHPVYRLNAASAVLIMMVGVMTFPTRARTLQALESAFTQD